MVNHTGALWHYIGSFLTYTLLTIGAIYAVYWYTRKATAARTPAPDNSATEEPPAGSLFLESALPLEQGRSLYVVRSGSERFLLSSTEAGTQLLSRWENAPPAQLDIAELEELVTATPRVDLPWYAVKPASPVAVEPSRINGSRQSSFGKRFIQIVQWLVSSRLR